MEFNEKLQELRKKKGITQQELADALFVSRTAVSKWESGKGYPSIDSLKDIAKFYAVTIDDLLSHDEVLTIAEESSKERESHLRDILFGFFDICMVLLFVLPFFGEKIDGGVREVSVFGLNSVSLYLKAAYIALITALAAFGVLTLALQNCRAEFWLKIKNKLSLALNLLAVLLFVMSLQPYAAVFVLAFLIIKLIFLVKIK